MKYEWRRDDHEIQRWSGLYDVCVHLSRATESNEPSVSCVLQKSHHRGQPHGHNGLSLAVQLLHEDDARIRQSIRSHQSGIVAVPRGGRLDGDVRRTSGAAAARDQREFLESTVNSFLTIFFCCISRFKLDLLSLSESLRSQWYNYS